MKKYNIMLVFIVLLGAGTLWAQDPQLSQPYSAPLILNPALTGNTYQDRVIANYRNQWPSIPGGYVTYAASYDRYFYKKNSGLGFYVLHDKAGRHGLQFTHLSASYAYNIRLSRFWGIRAGVKAGHTWRTYNKEKLLFWDQVARDNAPTTLESGLVDNISYPDFSAGGVVYSREFWGGVSFSHINQPNQSLLGISTRLPMKLSIHAGAKVPVIKKSSGEVKASVLPVAHYKAQQDWDQLDIGAYFSYEPLVAGIWYRGLPGIKSYKPGYVNHDAIVFLLGFEAKRFHIGYSYDLTISRLFGQTGGSQEISIIYEWPRQRRRRNATFVVPCAQF